MKIDVSIDVPNEFVEANFEGGETAVASFVYELNDMLETVGGSATLHDWGWE
jgi:hypothetical protein